jgi:hypothetical protein
MLGVTPHKRSLEKLFLPATPMHSSHLALQTGQDKSRLEDIRAQGSAPAT